MLPINNLCNLIIFNKNFELILFTCQRKTGLPSTQKSYFTNCFKKVQNFLRIIENKYRPGNSDFSKHKTKSKKVKEIFFYYF